MEIPSEVWIVCCETKVHKWIMPPMDSEDSFMAFHSKDDAARAIESQRRKYPDAFEDAVMTPVQIK